MGPKELARRKETAKLMVNIGLVAHLDNLIREILDGDASLLQEFQQMVQYATPSLKMKLLEKINGR